MAAAPLILAIDVGTSSTKTALFTTQARRLVETTAHQPYPLHVAADGMAQLDPGQVERAVLRAIRATLAAGRKHHPSAPIIAVGMSCFWHSLLGVRDDKPGPIYTWGDGRCRADATRLRACMSEKAYHARTGCLLRAPYWPAKLLWLRRTRQAGRDVRWYSPSDWLYGRLIGSFSGSISMASGTGLWDACCVRWDAALLKICGTREGQLPEISDEPIRLDRTRGSALAHRFPELRDALWFPALGDGACSNLGSDATSTDVAAINMGTSGAVRVMRTGAHAPVPAGLFRYQVDGTRSLVGGAISNAGNLRSWALRELRLPDHPGSVERALAARQMPHPGLTVLPFWAVERSPSWPEHLEGTVTGLTYATTALDLLQALTEATYHRLAQITNELAARHDSMSLVVSGGIQHSNESLQRLANVLGRPLRACTEPEASLRGAAVHVATRLDHRVKKLKAGRLYRPDRNAAAAYAHARQAQLALEATLAVPARMRL